MLHSKRVQRVYLDEATKSKNPPVGLGILQLLFAPAKDAEELAPRVVRKAKTELPDGELQAKVVELVEELLLSRFPQYGREEIRMKFKLHDLRESKVWKEATEEGEAKGKIMERRKTIQNCLAKGMTQLEIADLLEISVEDVKSLATSHRD